MSGSLFRWCVVAVPLGDAAPPLARVGHAFSYRGAARMKRKMDQRAATPFFRYEVRPTAAWRGTTYQETL